MKFKFTAAVVVEASGEEDALSKLSSRLANISRHIGSGAALADNAPFFSLEETTDGDPIDLGADPIRAARLAAEADAAAKSADTAAPAPEVPIPVAETGPSAEPTGETK